MSLIQINFYYSLFLVISILKSSDKHLWEAYMLVHMTIKIGSSGPLVPSVEVSNTNKVVLILIISYTFRLYHHTVSSENNNRSSIKPSLQNFPRVRLATKLKQDDTLKMPKEGLNSTDVNKRERKIIFSA